MDKSHVSIGQHLCPVCDKVFDSGEILLDNRLQKSLNPTTISGFELCEDHKKEGFCCFIVIDESKSTTPYTPFTAHKTGKHVHIKKDAVKVLFKDPEEIDEVNYMSEEAFKHLQSLVPNPEDNDKSATKS